MDTIWQAITSLDSAKFLFPLLLLILFSLPDALRKKRRYPKRTETPGQQPPQEGRKRTKQAPEDGRGRPLPRPERPHRTPVPPASPQPVPVQDVPVQDVPAAPVPAKPAGMVAAVPDREQPAPWSQVPPQAQDIYAGIVWSELLQPPLALRKKK